MELAKKTLYPIGIGTWHMGDDPSKKEQEITALKVGLDNGAQVIDTAEMYGEGASERLVGQVLPAYDREEIYLISKVYPRNAGKKSLRKSLLQSLERLQTDYLDLYLLHWRGEIPLAETVAAMEAVKAEGLIRDWGVSNFDVADLEELETIENGNKARANEVLYNLGSRGIDFDLLPYMREHYLPLIAYSPIAQGDSLGMHLSEQEELKKLAATHECTVFQLLLAWSIRDGKTIAIPQTSDPDHMRDNLAAGNIHLTEADLAVIDRIYPAPSQKQPLAEL